MKILDLSQFAVPAIYPQLSITHRRELSFLWVFASCAEILWHGIHGIRARRRKAFVVSLTFNLDFRRHLIVTSLLLENFGVERFWAWNFLEIRSVRGCLELEEPSCLFGMWSTFWWFLWISCSVLEDDCELRCKIGGFGTCWREKQLVMSKALWHFRVNSPQSCDYSWLPRTSPGFFELIFIDGLIDVFEPGFAIDWFRKI